MVRGMGRLIQITAPHFYAGIVLNEGKVRFRWKDYADGGKQKTATLEADEFIRRFLQHVLPSGFMRIRYYGFLANRHRADRPPEHHLGRPEADHGRDRQGHPRPRVRHSPDPPHRDSAGGGAGGGQGREPGGQLDENFRLSPET